MAPNTNIEIPKDKDNDLISIVPAVAAIKMTVNASIANATSITLQSGTTFLEVNAISQGIFMKYAAGVTTTSADEYIQAGTTRHYVVPTGVTVLSFIQQAATATLVLIEK